MSNAPATICVNCGASAPGAKFCPECGTPAADAHRIVPDTQVTELLDFTSGVDQPVPRRRPWALVVLSAVAVVGLLVGALGVWLAVGATHREQDLSSRFAGMAARVARQSATIKAAQTQLDSTANAESIKGVNDQLAKVNSTLAQYKNCIPEIQTELDNLTVDYNIDYNDASQDYFTVSNGSQTSHDCSSILYPR